MIPRFNIKRIKNRLEGNTRWMDYLPPILNFVAPPFVRAQPDLMLDELDFSFLQKFDAESPVYVDDYDNLYAANALTFVDRQLVQMKMARPNYLFYLSKRELNPLRFNIGEAPIVTRLTPLGEVLAKSVGMILPDFDWQQIAEPNSVSEEFFNMDDIILGNGNYSVGTIIEAMVPDDGAEFYQFRLDGDTEDYYYTVPVGSDSVIELAKPPVLFDPLGQYDAVIDLEGDAKDISGKDFDPGNGLYVYFSVSIGVPYDWTYDDNRDVLIDLRDLIFIRRQLFDKVKSDSIYIDDEDVYNFIFSGTVDENQLTLFGDLDG